jgi:hypothetical protein
VQLGSGGSTVPGSTNGSAFVQLGSGGSTVPGSTNGSASVQVGSGGSSNLGSTQPSSADFISALPSTGSGTQVAGGGPAVSIALGATAFSLPASTLGEAIAPAGAVALLAPARVPGSVPGFPNTGLQAVASAGGQGALWPVLAGLTLLLLMALTGLFGLTRSREVSGS